MEATNLLGYIVDGRWNNIIRYIEYGGDVNKIIEGEKTLLHFAIENRQLRILRMLINRGANLNHQDRYGRTPLHIALELYNDSINNDSDDGDEKTVAKRMVALLVRNGADIYIEDNEGETPNSISEKNNDEPGWIRQYIPDVPAEPPPEANLPSRNIPSGSSNAISYENIQDKNIMVNFLNESEQGRYESERKRYYKETTYNKLPINQTIGKKRNPYTRAPIDEIIRYKAHLVGGRKRKTRRRKTRKGTRRYKKRV